MNQNEPEIEQEIETDQSIPQQPSNTTWLNSKKYVLASTLILVMSLVLIGYLYKVQLDKSASNTQNSTIGVTPQATLTPYPGLLKGSMPLGNETLILSRNTVNDKDCSYSFEKEGQKYVPSNYTYVHCQVSDVSGELYTLIKEKENYIVLLDVPNKDVVVLIDKRNNYQARSYPMRAEQYNLIDIDETLDHWLVKENSIGDYLVLDANGKKAGQFTYDPQGYELFETLVDSVNKGVVFLTRKFDPEQAEHVFTKVDFVDFQSLQPKVILSTGSLPVAGRGCGSTTIQSVKEREILLYGDCLQFPKENMMSDGIIRIPL